MRPVAVCLLLLCLVMVAPAIGSTLAAQAFLPAGVTTVLEDTPVDVAATQVRCKPCNCAGLQHQQQYKQQQQYMHAVAHQATVAAAGRQIARQRHMKMVDQALQSMVHVKLLFAVLCCVAVQRQRLCAHWLSSCCCCAATWCCSAGPPPGLAQLRLVQAR